MKNAKFNDKTKNLKASESKDDSEQPLTQKVTRADTALTETEIEPNIPAVPETKESVVGFKCMNLDLRESQKISSNLSSVSRRSERGIKKPMKRTT